MYHALHPNCNLMHLFRSPFCGLLLETLVFCDSRFPRTLDTAQLALVAASIYHYTIVWQGDLTMSSHVSKYVIPHLSFHSYSYFTRTFEVSFFCFIKSLCRNHLMIKGINGHDCKLFTVHFNQKHPHPITVNNSFSGPTVRLLYFLRANKHPLRFLGHMLTVYGDVRSMPTISRIHTQNSLVSFGNILVTFFIVSLGSLHSYPVCL
jgi:hypothetical protein